MTTGRELTAILEGILREPGTLSEGIGRFQGLVWHTPESDLSLSELEEQVFGDLANDLEYFVANPQARSEDPSYVGSDPALSEIRAALARLAGGRE